MIVVLSKKKLFYGIILKTHLILLLKKHMPNLLEVHVSYVSIRTQYNKR